MSLDKNLFTLLFTPHKDNQHVIDLVDPSGTVHYRKQKVPGLEYKIEVYDPMSESLLATATALSPTTKVKVIELYNPTSVVEIKYTGTLSFRWSFKWEEHEFEWKREECFMIRKPDPPVIIAVTKEATGRLKTTSVQILDYNLNRFDIDDRKGLEIVLLTALLTFQDANEAYHTPEASTSSTNPLARASSAMLGTKADPPPAPPPKPAPKTGVERIAEMQVIKGEYNEIIVNAEGNVQEYAEYCNKLLQDDAMLFITVKSSEAEQVPKVLQVVEETKRIRYKAGLSEDEELHQYVLYDTQEAKKGPKRINLDDDPKDKYTPPKNLTVHLSKISMPELQPKGHGGKDKNHKDSKKKEDKKVATTTKPARPAPPAPAPATPAAPIPPSSSVPTLKPPNNNKLHRPGRSPSPVPPRVQPHKVHPDQPSPSPPKINNPGKYAAPPSTRPPPQPTTANSKSSRPAAAPGPSFPQPQISSGRASWGGAPDGKPPPSLYGSHAPYSSTPSSPPTYSNPNTNFSQMNWSSSVLPSAQPQLHQPQPVNANQAKPSTTSAVVQGASTVVTGLMDKLKTHTNRR